MTKLLPSLSSSRAELVPGSNFGAGSHTSVGGVDSYDPITDETNYQRTRGPLGFSDLELATKAGLGASPLLEIMQTEAEARPDYGEPTDLPFYYDLFINLPTAPVDWKAVGVAAGAFAVGSAVPRIKRHIQINSDLAKIEQSFDQGEAFIPYTRQEMKNNRLRERTKRGLITLLGCFAAYKAGEHGTLMQDMAAGGTLVVGATTAVGITKHRTKRRIERIKNRKGNRMNTNVFTDPDDFIDGRTVPDDDRLIEAPAAQTRHRGQLPAYDPFLR